MTESDEISDALVAEMLHKYPAIKKAWQIAGKPPVRRSLVPDEYESKVVLTSAMSRSFIEEKMLSQRDPTKSEDKAFNKNHIDALAKSQVRDRWLPFTKEIVVCRVTGNIIGGSHTVASNEKSGAAIGIRFRWGAQPIEEEIDGTQIGWKGNERAGMDQLRFSVANLHYRLHEHNTHVGSDEIKAWVSLHTPALNMVVEHVPKNASGGYEQFYKQGGLLLAMCEAVEHDSDGRMPHLLRNFRIKNKDNKWVEKITKWMISNAGRYFENRGKIYGAMVSILKHYLTDGNSDAPVRTGTRWEEVVQPVAEQDQTGDKNTALVSSLMRSLELTKNEAKRTAGYISLNSNGDKSAEVLIKQLDADFTTYELKSLLKRGNKLANLLDPFSTRAALTFIIETAAHATQPAYFSGISVKVLSEDWRIECYRPARVNLGREVATFDLNWIRAHFKRYCEAHEKRNTV